jgi:AcrR family transcriptional regulator
MGIGLGCASPEALAVIGADGVDALTMRALATRLGVVPGALYRHVRNKEQLRDLVLDGVLAEVDCQVDHRLAWTERVKVLAHRLRTVLEKHPGIAGLLKTRDPLGPHSLALAEAFLAPLHAAGLPERETGLAFALVYDYTLARQPSANPPLSRRATMLADECGPAAPNPNTLGSDTSLGRGPCLRGGRRRRIDGPRGGAIPLTNVGSGRR